MSDLPACVDAAIQRAWVAVVNPPYPAACVAIRRELAVLFRVPENPQPGDTWLVVCTHRPPRADCKTCFGDGETQGRYTDGSYSREIVPCPDCHPRMPWVTPADVERGAME